MCVTKSLKKIQLCPREHKPAHGCCFDLKPMILKLDPDLDILKMHSYTEHEVAKSSNCKGIAWAEKYENSS